MQDGMQIIIAQKKYRFFLLNIRHKIKQLKLSLYNSKIQLLYSMTKFSVLLSLYYKEQPSFLIQSLDSILSQTLLPNEIVLVKDGPLTPKLDSIVSEYEKRYNIIKVIPLEKNLGLGKALNEGLKYCSHDLVARMDTDDIAYPNRFEKQVKFMTDHPEIDACSSWIDEFIGSKDNIISTKKLPETSEEIKKYAKHRCPLNHPALIYRKRAVMAVNGYSGFPEDYNLWGRMLMNGSKFYNLQESLLYFRYSPEMIKRRGGWKYAKDELKSQIQFYKMGFIGLNTLIYNIAIRMIVRMVPNGFRDFIYKKFLRKK